MRKSLITAFAVTVLASIVVVGCTTTPYGYDDGYGMAYDDRPGPLPYHPDDRRYPGRPPVDDRYHPDDRMGDRRAYRGEDLGRGDQDRRRPGPMDRHHDQRYADPGCHAGDLRDCPPPSDGMVQPLPPSYYAEKRRAAARTAPRAAPKQTRAHGEWRVQLGAFSQESRASALRSRVSRSPALANHNTYLVRSGGMTRVQAGPLPSAAAARQLCARLKAAGHACIVKSG